MRTQISTPLQPSNPAQCTKGAPTKQNWPLWKLHATLCLAGHELTLGNGPKLRLGGKPERLGHVLEEEEQ